MTRRDPDRDRPVVNDDLFNDGVNIGTNRVVRGDPYDQDRAYYQEPRFDHDRYGYNMATDRGYYGPNVDRGQQTPAYLPSGAPSGAHAGRGPRNYRRSDERIEEDVNESLTAHGELDATDVQVRVRDGEVTLSGTVADRPQKRLAARLAEDVRGVRDVHNQLRLRPQDS